MKNRVRYICVPVTSFELADALPEHDKAVFIQQVLMMFKCCEAGEDPVPDQTENRVLDIALEGAAREIKKGYDSYVKRMNARAQSLMQQSPINDVSMNAIEEREKNIKDLIDNDIKESSEGLQGGRPLTETEMQSINAALSYAEISPDSQFWTFARKVGFRITVDSIRKARDEHSRSLPYVVKLMSSAIQ